MGGEQTAEPPDIMEPSEEDGSEGLRPAQSDGARSEHGALARCKYDRLALEKTEGGLANVGNVGREGGHGATENQ